MVQPNAQIEQTINLIEKWLKQFSFLFVRYKSWSIGTTLEWYPPNGNDYPASYDAGTNQNAHAVIEYFTAKGIKLEIKGSAGRYIHIHKTYSI